MVAPHSLGVSLNRWTRCHHPPESAQKTGTIKQLIMDFFFFFKHQVSRIARLQVRMTDGTARAVKQDISVDMEMTYSASQVPSHGGMREKL